MSSNIALPRYPRDATNPDTPRRDGKKHCESQPIFQPHLPSRSTASTKWPRESQRCESGGAVLCSAPIAGADTRGEGRGKEPSLLEAEWHD